MKLEIKQLLAVTITLIVLLCTLSACGTKPEKSILGKWYNENGDCIEIQSDNTYKTDFVEKIGKPIGSGTGKWVYLEEENIFKFYSNDDKVWEINISKDSYGESFEYSYYGTFYKNDFPIEIIEEKEKQYIESTIICPDFVGESYEHVVNDDDYSNFNFEVSYKYSNDYDAGIICYQSKEPGERIYKDTIITIYVSLGTKSVFIPDVYGMKQEDAVKALRERGFEIEIATIYNNEIQEGYVIKTEPARNNSIAENSKIILYISGKE